MPTLGEVVRRLRTERNLSLGQLAIKTKLTKPTIREIETGRTESPRVDSLVAIALALDTTPDAILIECGIIAPPDSETVWQPELLVMQRVLDAVAEIDPQLRADLSRIVLGQAEGWRQLTELAKTSDIPEQDEDTTEAL